MKLQHTAGSKKHASHSTVLTCWLIKWPQQHLSGRQDGQDVHPHWKCVCHFTELECLTGPPSHLHCLRVLDVGHNVDRLLLLAAGCHELLNLHEAGQHLGICLFAGDAWHAACRVCCQQLRSRSWLCWYQLVSRASGTRRCAGQMLVMRFALGRGLAGKRWQSPRHRAPNPAGHRHQNSDFSHHKSTTKRRPPRM